MKVSVNRKPAILTAAFLFLLALTAPLPAQTARPAANANAATVFPRLVPDEKAALFSHSGDYTWMETVQKALQQ